MKHTEILAEAVAMLRDRGQDYGDENELFERVCVVYNLITGEHLTPWHAAIFLHCLKLVRIKPNMTKLDNYADGINYMAFAGQFADARGTIIRPNVPTPQPQQQAEAEQQVDDGIARMVQMFGQQRPDNPEA